MSRDRILLPVVVALAGLCWVAATGACLPRARFSPVELHCADSKLRAPLSGCDILAAPYNATGGPNWTNWLTDRPIGSWRGVSVDGEGRAVCSDIKNLQGSIPSEIGGFQGTTGLYLAGHRLEGPVPAVPQVTGENASPRAFPTAQRAIGKGIPVVCTRSRVNGKQGMAHDPVSRAANNVDTLLLEPEKDLMPCGELDPASDWRFTKALDFRLFAERPTLVASLIDQEVKSLLLWGGTDADGEPYLNPAFVIDAPPALPDATGEHRITGQTTSGEELFSLDFVTTEVADGDGSSSFAFVLPVEPDWAGSLASITLSGPGGSARLDGDTDLPMTILLDPVSGRVRAMLRDVPLEDARAALASQAGPDSLDVLFSRGIPDPGAWDR